MQYLANMPELEQCQLRMCLRVHALVVVVRLGLQGSAYPRIKGPTLFGQPVAPLPVAAAPVPTLVPADDTALVTLIGPIMNVVVLEAAVLLGMLLPIVLTLKLKVFSKWRARDSWPALSEFARLVKVATWVPLSRVKKGIRI